MQFMRGRPLASANIDTSSPPLPPVTMLVGNASADEMLIIRLGDMSIHMGTGVCTKKKGFLLYGAVGIYSPPLPPCNNVGGMQEVSRKRKNSFFSQRYEAPKTLHQHCYRGRGGAPGWRGGGCQEPLFSRTPVTCSTCCHIVTTPECVP